MAAGLASIFAASGGLSEQTGYPGRPSDPAHRSDGLSVPAPPLLSASLPLCWTAPGPVGASMSTSRLARYSRPVRPTRYSRTSSGFRGRRGLANGHRRWRPMTSIRAPTADGLPSPWLTTRRDTRWVSVHRSCDRRRTDRGHPGMDGHTHRTRRRSGLAGRRRPASPVMSFAHSRRTRILRPEQVSSRSSIRPRQRRGSCGHRGCSRAGTACHPRPGPRLGADNDECPRRYSTQPRRAGKADKRRPRGERRRRRRRAGGRFRVRCRPEAGEPNSRSYRSTRSGRAGTSRPPTPPPRP